LSVQVQKRRRSGLRWVFWACAIGKIARNICIRVFSTEY